MKRTNLFTVILATLAIGSTATAQSPYGQDQAAAIGEMTGEMILTALREDGRVSMSGGFFNFDSAALTETSPDALAKIAIAMEFMPEMRLAIIGHTDASGDFNYNVGLSKLRADAVRIALINEPYNVKPERLVAMGAGPIAPVVSNVSDEGRALNRRVEFLILNQQMMQH